MFGWIMLALVGFWAAAFFAWAVMWWAAMLCLGWAALCIAWVWRMAARACRGE